MTRSAGRRAFPTLSSWARRPRGSALVLTMLVLLVLTALGMTAMHSVGRSLNQSGAYRVRTQAEGLTNAALVYTSYDVGKKAKDYWRRMTDDQAHGLKDLGSAERLAKAQRGYYLVLTQDPTVTQRPFAALNASGETGLLAAGGAGGTAIKSFERKFESSGGVAGTQFSVVIRDPIEGPTAPSYGQEGMCFKKVTIASRSLVGNPLAGWEGAGMVASRRAASEAYIGPVACGAR